MNPSEFREIGHKVVDLLAEYLENIEEQPVFPRVDLDDRIERKDLVPYQSWLNLHR